MELALALGVDHAWQFLLISTLLILGFCFWFWSLIDVMTNKHLTSSRGMMWVVFLVCLPVAGSLIYWGWTVYPKGHRHSLH